MITGTTVTRTLALRLWCRAGPVVTVIIIESSESESP